MTVGQICPREYGDCFHPNFAFWKVIYCLNVIRAHCMAYKLSVDEYLHIFGFSMNITFKGPLTSNMLTSADGVYVYCKITYCAHGAMKI